MTICFYCNCIIEMAAKYCHTCGNKISQQNGPLRLNNRYEIKYQLGSGGYGVVYYAIDHLLKCRPCAIKVIDHKNEEAFLLAQLSHPSLPAVYDCFDVQNKWYIVMEYINGETLRSLLSTQKDGILSYHEVLNIAIQIANVFLFLHNQTPQIIFRDLKPENVMISNDQHIYLIDFGIARVYKTGQNKDTTVIGSQGYAAPEQYGSKQTTIQADIYSLGAVLHELLSGNYPGDTPFHFVPLKLPQQAIGLAELILQMTQIDISLRPKSMKEVLFVLQRLQKTLLISQTQKSMTIQKNTELQEPVVNQTISVICIGIDANGKEKLFLLHELPDYIQLFFSTLKLTKGIDCCFLALTSGLDTFQTFQQQEELTQKADLLIYLFDNIFIDSPAMDYLVKHIYYQRYMKINIIFLLEKMQLFFENTRLSSYKRFLCSNEKEAKDIVNSFVYYIEKSFNANKRSNWQQQEIIDNDRK